jgi:phosphoglycolate phosphatase
MSAVPERPACVLFDWDNTLVDAWGGVQVALNAAREAFGLEAWDRTMLLANVRLSLRDSFPVMFGPDWERARTIFADSYARAQFEHLAPLPGAEEALVAAAGLGFAGVVSNKTGRFLRKEARHLGWARHCGALVGAGDAARDKPHADPILLALATARVPPGPQVWYVGDTITDLQAARAAGCTAVLVGDAQHEGGLAALAAAGVAADLHFPDATALAQHLP